MAKTYGLYDDWLYNLGAGLGVNSGGTGTGATNPGMPIPAYPRPDLQEPGPQPLGIARAPGAAPTPAPLPTTKTPPAGMINVGEWFKKEGFNAEWMNNSVRINGIPVSTADMQLYGDMYYASPEVLERISHMIPVNDLNQPPVIPSGTVVEEGGGQGGGGTGGTDETGEQDDEGGETNTTGGGNTNDVPENEIDNLANTLKSIIDKNREGLPILTWEQALEQSRAQMDPLYADKAKDLQKLVDTDLIRRGIFRSGLGGKITADKMGDLYNEQVAAIAQLAQTLVEASREASFTDRGLDIDEMSAEGGILGNLINSLIGREGNQMSYELGKEQNAISRAQATADANYKQWAMDNEGKASEWEKFQMAYNIWQDTGSAPDADVLAAYGIEPGTALSGGLAGDMTWAQEYAAGMESWERLGTAPDSKVLKFFGIMPGMEWTPSAAEQAKAIELKILKKEYAPYVELDAVGAAFSGIVNQFGTATNYTGKNSGDAMDIDITEAAITALIQGGGSVKEGIRIINDIWPDLVADKTAQFEELKNRSGAPGNLQKAAVEDLIEKLAGEVDFGMYFKSYVAAEETVSELPTIGDFIEE